MDCMYAELGLDVARVPVWLVITHFRNYEKVGVRVFSTKEKAEKFKEFIETAAMFNRELLFVQLSERLIDETKEETKERSGRKFCSR